MLKRWPQRVQTRGSTSSSRTRGRSYGLGRRMPRAHSSGTRRTTAVRSRVRRDRTSRTPVALVRPPGAAPRAAERNERARLAAAPRGAAPRPAPGRGESPAASAGGRPACHVDKARRAHGQARSGLLAHMTSGRTPTCRPETSAWAAARSGTCSGCTRDKAAQILSGRAWGYLDRWNRSDDELARLFHVVPVRPTASLCFVMSDIKVDHAGGDRARPAKASIDSGSATSTTSGCVPGRADFGSRTPESTRQPSDASGRATSRPMPRPAQVISAVLAVIAPLSPSAALILGAEQRFDRATLVHRAIALGHLVERQGKVEDLAGVDLPGPAPGRSAGAGSGAPAPGRREGGRGRRTARCPSSSTPCGTPTKPTDPPGRVARIACIIASCVPTHSRTESAPTPFVSSLMRATPSSPRSVTMSVAPNSRASFCREA